MNGRIFVLCALVLGLLGLFFAATAMEARETREDTVEAERTLVYDYKSGTFVHAHRHRPSQYRLGTLKMDVGYDEQIYRAKDAWPYGVTRFLFKRPLDQ
ncbi:MAG TPA: hypothetical protein VLJ37_02985 [bacterium]|nr:hypothetical protein [bacterium]